MYALTEKIIFLYLGHCYNQMKNSFSNLGTHDFHSWVLENNMEPNKEGNIILLFVALQKTFIA